VPVLLLWQEAQVPAESVDWVVTVPETFGPLCIMVKLTTVVPVPVPGEPVFGFVSVPVPSNVGAGCCAPLFELAPGAPIPPPQDATSAASAATVMTFGTGFMSKPRSPSR
jgi:hypothetical protein